MSTTCYTCSYIVRYNAVDCKMVDWVNAEFASYVANNVHNQWIYFTTIKR